VDTSASIAFVLGAGQTVAAIDVVHAPRVAADSTTATRAARAAAARIATARAATARIGATRALTPEATISVAGPT